MRFNTDRALFDAFPSARDHIKTEPADRAPSVFLSDLIQRDKLEEAISFCAYLLPRREAVAWGCRCLRAKRRDDDATAAAVANAALDAADAWAASPSEEGRVLAYNRWTSGDREDPAVWLALAAAWSGGSLSPDLPNSMSAPPHLTATAVRVGLILALHSIAKAQKSTHVRGWIAAGLRLAEDGIQDAG